MRQRFWLVGAIVVASLALGVLVSGIPGDARDRPLSVRVATASSASTTTMPATTTVAPTTTAAPTTTTPPPRAPAEVHVRVANASTAGMAATNLSTRLAGMGYQMLAPLNANRSNLATTVVVFTPGFEPEARALAQAIGATQVASGDPTLTCEVQACAGDVVVFVGHDLAT